MTFQEFIDLVPAEKRDYQVEFLVDAGQFPSGEEGAEDWIMSSSFKDVDVNDERKIIWIDVTYA